MMWLVHGLLLSLVGVGLSVRWWRRYGSWPIYSLLLKCAGAMALGWMYWAYYDGGDTWSLMDQMMQLHDVHGESLRRYWSAIFAPIDPWSGNPRTVFTVRLLSALAVWVDHNYWLLGLYLALWSFVSAWYLIDTLITYYPASKWAAILSFGFLPSVLFWSSGVLKDTLANGCLWMLVAILIQGVHGRRLNFKHFLLGVVCFFLLFKIRHYLAAVFFFTAVYTLMDMATGKFGWTGRLGIGFFLCMMSVLGIGFFYAGFQPRLFPEIFYDLHQTIVQNSSEAAIIHFDLQPNWPSLLMNLPLSLWTGLFRPLPFDHLSWLSSLLALENVVLGFGFIWSIRYLPRVPKLSSLLLAGMIFILILASVLPLVTPNFGSLSRYRVGYLPFLFYLVGYGPLQRWADWKVR